MRFPQYSLRFLIVFVTITTIVLGWLTQQRNNYVRQHNALTRFPSVFCRRIRYRSSDAKWFPRLREVFIEYAAVGEIAFMEDMRHTDMKLAAMLYDVHRLSFAGSRVKSEDLIPFRDATIHIRTLDFGNTKVTDAGIECFTRIRSLNALDLGGCDGIRGNCLKVIPHAHLQCLTLSHSSVCDRALASLDRFSCLRRLYLDGCAIGDISLRFIGRRTLLEELDLSDTRISDDGLRELRYLKKLKVLNLSRTRVSWTGIEHLQDLPQLANLRIDGTDVRDEFLQLFRDRHSLRKLRIDAQQLRVMLSHERPPLIADALTLEVVDGGATLSQLQALKDALPEVDVVFITFSVPMSPELLPKKLKR